MKRVLAAFFLSVTAFALVVPASVAADEPPGFEYFHTYAESEAAIDAAVANFPNLAQKVSIGKSYHGRSIWAVKLTADVGAGNQGRPEVLIEAMMHARERAAGELALYMIDTLTQTYGHTSTKVGRRATAILDTRVIYIIPMVNVDGAVYDFKDNEFHSWRKNRQPVPNSSEVGVDPNRNFGFMWGCCGGSSGNPASETYRGPSAWYATEDVALRDFINSRVIDGQQRITEMLSIHSAGREILWPYGYTTVNVPSTMTAEDHKVFVALANGVAQRNGYTPMQSSHLYVTDGDSNDWEYHAQGIFALTLELAKGAERRYYPSESELTADLGRNRGAVLWFLEQGNCPYRAAGLAGQYCATVNAMQSMSLASVNLTARLARAGRSMD